jgi:hypothetical protein
VTQPQLKLIRVVIRGEGLANDTATFGDVEYKRENGGPTAIYMTLLKPKWRSDVSYPARDDDRMKITPMGMPFSKSVGTEFCGSDIDQMVAAAGAQETVAGAVAQIAPLLKYFQENFSVA